MDAPHIRGYTNRELKLLIASDPELSSEIRRFTGLPLIEETDEIIELRNRFKHRKLTNKPVRIRRVEDSSFAYKRVEICVYGENKSFLRIIFDFIKKCVKLVNR